MQKWIRFWVIALLGFTTSLLWAAELEEMQFYVIDVGTGLAVYMEIPQPGSDVPLRVLYDTGLDVNVAVKFLTSKKIGLQVADGDFKGTVIDYFLLSHPHEDHFNGAKNIFANFDIRNIVESKQAHGPKYLSNFKVPAINEILDARARGETAEYYVVGLPYPNGFKWDKNAQREAYDEYALAKKNLPEFLKGDLKEDVTDKTFPFKLVDISQRRDWPFTELLGKGFEKSREKILTDAETFPITILPIGARFSLGPESHFTVVHGDSIAGLNGTQKENSIYKEAHPYFKGFDANDSSLSIQIRHGKSSFFIPGDSEGRPDKPDKRTTLAKMFGIQGPLYLASDINGYIKKQDERTIDLLPGYSRYKMGARELLERILAVYLPYGQFNRDDISIETPRGTIVREAKSFASANEMEGFSLLDHFSATQGRKITRNLFQIFELQKEDANIFNVLWGRFKAWVKGKEARLLCADGSCQLNITGRAWNIISLMQLANRIHHVDPALANIVSGIILGSDLFMDFVAPDDPKKRAYRAEKHMLHVRQQILSEAPTEDVLRSDVLLFGHHGSFTSSSIDFVQAVDPSIGVISADDKVYGAGGGTLPDFLHLFWNINTYHERPRTALHSILLSCGHAASGKRNCGCHCARKTQVGHGGFYFC